LLFDQTFGEFAGIPDGCRSENELRLCPIKGSHTFQPANDVGDMRAEDPAIGMGFINDDELQVGEEVVPVGMMRQDAGVQHIWIGEHNACVLANGWAVLCGSIAIVNGGWEV